MIDISQEDFGTLCVCALRYCHGRQTYMPSLVQRIVMSHFGDLSERDLKVIADHVRQDRLAEFLSDLERIPVGKDQRMNDRKIKELEGRIAFLEKALLELEGNTLKLARYVDRLTDVVNGLIERETVKQKGATDE